jgi:hypothetical protein
MITFDIENNDLCLILIKYKELYLKELTYYGTSETEQMFMLINLGQEISKLENNIINKYYTKFTENVNQNNTDPNIYNLQKILYSSFNTLLLMTMLWIVNKRDTEEFEYKSRYLVGSIENFVDKFINPLSNILNLIISSNKIFKIENNIDNLKKFIMLNKHKFTSKEKIKQLENFISLIN